MPRGFLAHTARELFYSPFQLSQVFAILFNTDDVAGLAARCGRRRAESGMKESDANFSIELAITIYLPSRYLACMIYRFGEIYGRRSQVTSSIDRAAAHAPRHDYAALESEALACLLQGNTRSPTYSWRREQSVSREADARLSTPVSYGLARHLTKHASTPRRSARQVRHYRHDSHLYI
jgi:hypothetical protein